MSDSAASIAGLGVSFSIGETIREARELRDLTQEYVAAFTNISRPQLANIERGHAMPSVATIEEVADALNVSFVYETKRGWRFI